jgi:hypothetical protein
MQNLKLLDIAGCSITSGSFQNLQELIKSKKPKLEVLMLQENLIISSKISDIVYYNKMQGSLATDIKTDNYKGNRVFLSKFYVHRVLKFRILSIRKR